MFRFSDQIPINGETLPLTVVIWNCTIRKAKESGKKSNLSSSTQKSRGEKKKKKEKSSCSSQGRWCEMRKLKLEQTLNK